MAGLFLFFFFSFIRRKADGGLYKQPHTDAMVTKHHQMLASHLALFPALQQSAESIVFR